MHWMYPWLVDGHDRVWLLVGNDGQGLYRLADSPKGSTPVPGEDVASDFAILETGPKVLS